MKKIWKPTLFFVLCLLVFLVVNLPVSLILGQIAVPNNIKLNGVKGRVTSGRIDAIYVNQFPILDINYNVDLSCLLTLSICYQVTYQNGSGNISFAPLTNTAAIQQLNVDYAMTELSSLMEQLLVKPTGELNLNFHQISIKQSKITNVEGLAIWSNAGIEGEDINLGTYQLGVVREKESYQFELIDKKAVLDIDGKGRLKSNGQYLLDIKILTESSLNDSIKSILELATRKKGLNEYSLHREGQLPSQIVNQLEFSDTN